MPSNNYYVRTRDAMPCPACHGPTQVKETRGTDKNTIRRRRHCAPCGIAFTTLETFHAFDARDARNGKKQTPEESMQAEAKAFAAMIPQDTIAALLQEKGNG